MIPLLSKTLTIPSLPLRCSTRLTLTPHSLFTRFTSTPTPTQTRPMSSDSIQRVFQLKLDPLTGNSEWVIIEDGNKEEEETFKSSSNALLATTSYLDMLNDDTRNRAFREAIDKTITKPCHVLDIGAGTGLLSMMAARAMGTCDDSKKGMVTACESYLPMVKLMRKVLNLNGMGKNVKIFNKRSDELQVGVDIPSRADVLVSEILDSELLGEGLIPTLQHAHDMLLVDNPLTVPYRATTYGQLVESTFLWKLHDLSNNEEEASDGIHLVPAGLDTILRVQAKQHPMHCDAISKEINLLSEPFKIFEFDFWKRPDSQGDSKLLIKATNDGRIHAVVSWWILQLDSEGTIFYSTAPRWITSPIATYTGNWCDHWKQCVWFIPGEGIPISKGEEVHLHAVHSDTSVSYNLATQATEIRECDSIAGDSHLTLCPERIAIYGDRKWRSCMLTALKNLLQARVHPLCVVADDSVFLSLLVAHLSKTSNVIALFPGLRERGVQYLKAVADANGITADRIEVFQKKKYLTLNDTKQKKVDLLIGEPYYYGNDGMLPWQNFRFWKERTMLDSVLAEDVLVMPCKATLKACAMSLPDLWKSHRCLSKIEDFDHSIVNNTLGACGDLPAPLEGPLLPFFIWQCGETKELSETFTIMEFDLSKSIGPCYGKAQVINPHLPLSFFCNSEHQGHYCWDLVVRFLGSKFLDIIPYSRSWFVL
ncbi:protein arginine N-methyltransferase 1.6 [Populus alba x Populus x berolinensis]|uniref:Protein arginine N-methyltransferase 1.6 n=1 Tax=Populus alba x Populus x berolinensis TaxID=444605 RepID=A0AAD6W967_9ROSI|nr:protein arginine N-methyltransferase 1.6 [Populus alba x Populus x berolinensis]